MRPGSISPYFVCQGKRRRGTAFGKKTNATQFHQKWSKIEILSCMLNFVSHLPNLCAIRQTPFAKNLREKKSGKNIGEIDPCLFVRIHLNI